MELGLSEDQSLLLRSLERLVDGHRAVPADAAHPYLQSAAFERDLGDNGYFDIGRQDGFGAADAAMVIEAVATAPYAVEIAASGLIGPKLGLDDIARPLAIAEALDDSPVRFLRDGGAAVIDTGKELLLLRRVEGSTPVDTRFAYPFGRLPANATDIAEPLDASRATLRLWRQVALGAEAVGAMQAALDLTTRYVTDRHQFGRPIGAFQAVQHRLAECACLLAGARLMTLKSATTGDADDADLAARHGLDAVRRIIFETNQLHGAIGLTLEYPLHLWSYRLRALQGELAGTLG